MSPDRDNRVGFSRSQNPLSHLRKVEVRLSPPSAVGVTTDLHTDSIDFFSRNQLELEARPALNQRPRNCGE